MRTTTLANAKARLSSLVDQVERGEEVVITRRGRPVARILRVLPESSEDHDRLMADVRAFVLSQPMIRGDVVSDLRQEARY